MAASELSQTLSLGEEPALDTIAMAKEARKDQESFENEVNFGSEADLHRHYNSCEKNPGHHKFTPVRMFTKDHLPPNYRDDDIVNCILALAKITVRIMSKSVSPYRPDTYPNNDKPYPFSNYRGQNMMIIGSGWILHVNREQRLSKSSCPCKECSHSKTPQTKYVEIEIRTAAHTVYDRIEAENSTCDLFFDEGGVPGHESIKLTSGWITHLERDFEGDMCDLTYVTHDLNLADRLEKAVSLYESLHALVKEKYSNNDHSESVHRLTVIVSHPHGCSKQITVGEYVEVNRMESRETLTQYIYNTPTCGGSSGAPVFVLGRSWLWLLCEHPHSGSYDNTRNLNYSGFALG